MNLPLLKKPWPPGPHKRRPCPVCGEGWRPWAGSYLPCHARCVFTEEERQAILKDPRTDLAMSKAYGVTTSVIRSVRIRGMIS